MNINSISAFCNPQLRRPTTCSAPHAMEKILFFLLLLLFPLLLLPALLLVIVLLRTA